MDEKDKHIIMLVECLYYMMGIVEGFGSKAQYDFVLETIDAATKVIGAEVV